MHLQLSIQFDDQIRILLFSLRREFPMRLQYHFKALEICCIDDRYCDGGAVLRVIEPHALFPAVRKEVSDGRPTERLCLFWNRDPSDRLEAAPLAALERKRRPATFNFQRLNKPQEPYLVERIVDIYAPVPDRETPLLLRLEALRASGKSG
jgi:hypothetical protein